MDSHPHAPSHRAIRPPPSRRALFHPSSRRAAPTSVVRPDTGTIGNTPGSDELVERNEKGEYKVDAPSTSYKHMAREGEEEEEAEIIAMYGKPQQQWDQEVVDGEIRSALKRSVKKMTAELEDDRWMFEGEGKGEKK